MTISAVIIAFNEADKIARCLQSVKVVADEIVVVDSGSTDNTVDICEALGARVIHQPFLGYIEQKNFAASLANADYILSLDADEALSEPLQQWLLQAKQKGLSKDAYIFHRLNNYCGQWIKHGDYYPDKKLRLWRKELGHWGGENPHDKVITVANATIEKVPLDILHWSFASRDEHRKQMIRFSDIAAQAMYKRGKRVSPLKPWLSAAWSFLNGFIFRAGFLDGTAGWSIARMNAFYSYHKYAQLQALYK
ncbi:glycosyltransferase family 2 protein [Phnomibacter sp. MR]|uniref:glycosyltransferase family 2 protein n=1 Tax=Phnomibacter sp. MR TaxID=3042318 RepID=UPI003A7FD0C8